MPKIMESHELTTADVANAANMQESRQPGTIEQAAPAVRSDDSYTGPLLPGDFPRECEPTGKKYRPGSWTIPVYPSNGRTNSWLRLLKNLPNRLLRNAQTWSKDGLAVE